MFEAGQEAAEPLHLIVIRLWGQFEERPAVRDAVQAGADTGPRDYQSNRWVLRCRSGNALI
jgi:hypothetical protein